jgi:predicted ATP-dependent endonuclease of OLD family
MNYKRLEYFNFKGVLNDSQIVKIDFENQTSSNKNIEITTKNKLTLISGKNAIGKTTILDAITFLFINKL